MKNSYIIEVQVGQKYFVRELEGEIASGIRRVVCHVPDSPVDSTLDLIATFDPDSTKLRVTPASYDPQIRQVDQDKVVPLTIITPRLSLYANLYHRANIRSSGYIRIISMLERIRRGEIRVRNAGLVELVSQALNDESLALKLSLAMNPSLWGVASKREIPVVGLPRSAH